MNFIEIRSKLTIFHYVSGVEFWLNALASKLIDDFKNANKQNNDNNLTWNEIKPNIEEFKVDWTFESEKNLDVMMWNWKDRYFNIFG